MSYPVIRDSVGRGFDIIAYFRNTMNNMHLEEAQLAVSSKTFLIGEPVISEQEKMDDLFMGKLVYDLVGSVGPAFWGFFPIFAEASESVRHSDRRQLLGFLSTVTLW
jgi:hypothetical protein